MALDEKVWLPQAKRLAVGMKGRIRHMREGRLNLVIGNDRDRWWAYCQSCKEGGVLMKEHVILTADQLPLTEADLKLPCDIKVVRGSEYEDIIGKFLLSKGMHPVYLPKLWCSARAKRLLLQDSAGNWHGRDLTGRSERKWLNYNHAQYAWGGEYMRNAVATEDLFSMYKIQYALDGAWATMGRRWVTICTLGAGCGTAAALAMRNCNTVTWAYDADKAGDAGYASGSKRMRSFGSKQLRARPPEGLDPKDMDIADIRTMIQEAR